MLATRHFSSRHYVVQWLKRHFPGGSSTLCCVLQVLVGHSRCYCYSEAIWLSWVRTVQIWYRALTGAMACVSALESMVISQQSLSTFCPQWRNLRHMSWYWICFSTINCTFCVILCGVPPCRPCNAWAHEGGPKHGTLKYFWVRNGHTEKVSSVYLQICLYSYRPIFKPHITKWNTAKYASENLSENLASRVGPHSVFCMGQHLKWCYWPSWSAGTVTSPNKLTRFWFVMLLSFLFSLICH